MSKMRVLVLGGNGLFGHRVGRLFSQWRSEEAVEILIGCRSQEKASRAVQTLQSFQNRSKSGNASISFVPFVTGDLPSVHESSDQSDRHWQDLLRSSEAKIVINTVGPFVLHNSQNTDASDAAQSIASCFTMAKHCAMQGIHYIDLADERAYLQAFEKQLDSLAQQNQVCLVTGASTTPGLTMEIVKMMYEATYPSDGAPVWDQLNTLTWALSPGNRIGDEGTGAATVESILRTVGKEITPAEGRNESRRQFVWDRVVTFPFRWLGERRFVAPVDQADIDVASREYGSSHSVPVSCYAGIELHSMTWSLSFLSRLFRLVPAFKEPIIRLSTYLTPLTRKLGTDRGGFAVEVEGSSEGQSPKRRRFDLIAEKGDGPFIPALPSFCIACHLLSHLNKASPVSGAVICGTSRASSLFAFKHFQHVIDQQQLALYWSVFDERSRESAYLYPRVMGSSFYRLPLPIQKMHAHSHDTVSRGTCKVARGTSVISRLVGGLLSLPKEGENVPTKVRLITKKNQETWHRDFDGRKFYTTQEDQVTKDTPDGFLVESIPLGWFPLALKAVARIEGDEKQLNWVIHSMSLGGILPIPSPFSASVRAQESLDPEGRFQFDVQIDLPLGLGLLVHYQGSLDL